MSKRLCPFTENVHPIKKQEINIGGKERRIMSSSSERALQLLFIGASRHFSAKLAKDSTETLKSPSNLIICSQCAKAGECDIKCCYCDKVLCGECCESCEKCDQQFCPRCTFNLTDKGYSICYSCY